MKLPSEIIHSAPSLQADAPAGGLAGMLMVSVELHLLHRPEFCERQRTRTT